MDRKQNNAHRKSFENKRLPAQIVSPGNAFGILCFVNLEETKSPIATKISETEVVKEIKRFENTTHLVAKELEFAAEALKKDNYLEESEILETHILRVINLSAYS
jgi:phosphoenolpyruvate-protein kinase (PTS system EI component)